METQQQQGLHRKKETRCCRFSLNHHPCSMSLQQQKWETWQLGLINLLQLQELHSDLRLSRSLAVNISENHAALFRTLFWLLMIARSLDGLKSMIKYGYIPTSAAL